MKPPKFDYFAPDSIESALALIREHGGDARFLAGGSRSMKTAACASVR